MSGKILPLFLSFTFFLFVGISICETPVTEIVTSTTVSNINATVLQYFPTRSFDFRNLVIDVPDSEVTGLTQKKPDSTNLYLFSLDINRYVQRSVVTLNATGFDIQPQKKFGIRVSSIYSPLQLTQFTNPLAVSVSNKAQYKAYFLNSKGFYSHHSAQIYPNNTGEISGGISADGRFSWSSINNGTFYYGIQRLTPTFKPDGNPIMVDTPNIIISGDITGELPGGVRLFVYRETKLPVNSLYPTRVLIQKFDSVSLQLVGKPYALTKYRSTPFSFAERAQSIAVDPQGFGVAFTKYSGSCDKELLQFRFLDSNYKPFGKSKLLLGCNDLTSGQGVEGLDILPVKLTF